MSDWENILKDSLRKMVESWAAEEERRLERLRNVKKGDYVVMLGYLLVPVKEDGVVPTLADAIAHGGRIKFANLQIDWKRMAADRKPEAIEAIEYPPDEPIIAREQ